MPQLPVEGHHVARCQSGRQAKPLQGAEAPGLAKCRGAGMAAEGQPGGLDTWNKRHDHPCVQSVKPVGGIEGDNAFQVRAGVGGKVSRHGIEALRFWVAVFFGDKGRVQRDLRRDEEDLVQSQGLGKAQRSVAAH